MIKPHVVILGAGFGGTYVAKYLCKRAKKGEIDITIVNKTNYFLFTPLLHEVATGSLTPASVAEPIREIFHGTGMEFFQGMVRTVDMANRRVHVDGNGSRHTLTYDYLVIATGAESNYYGIPGAMENSLPLKSLADAARIRSRIIDSFERAIVTEDPAERKHLLSYVVVGGGPTGVETVAELEEFVSGMVKRYYRTCGVDEPTISLIHTGPELLPQFPEALRKAAEKRINSKKINLILNKSVTEVTPKVLKLSDGSEVTAGTIIWAAGVKPIIPEFAGDTPAITGGRIAVDKNFRVTSNERVFALGDVAGYVDMGQKVAEGSHPQPVPMLAQAAVNEARILAKNILLSIKGKKLKSFHYHSKGALVSVGRWFAVGEIYLFNTTGRLTWWIWKMVYLFKFASWRKRIRIAFEWFIGMFYARDVTKLT